MKSKNRLLLLVIFFLMILLLANPSANACSRVLYHGLEGTVITGRTMDWTEDIGTNLDLPKRNGTRRKSGTQFF